MLSISSASVPEYLRSGVFFQNLDMEDGSEFEIPANCYKKDSHIETIQDLDLLLNTVRFWGLHEPPIDVFQFIVRKAYVPDCHDLRNDFPELGQYIENVLAVKKIDLFERIPEALKRNMNMVVVVWLHHHGGLLTGEAAECAASNGDIESLMYLHSHHCPWDERTTTAAATNRNVDCLLFAIRSKCAVDNKLMNVIAKMGYIDVLKVLHNEGIPLDEAALIAAVQGKHLDCVRFLRNQGCPMEDSVCTDAVDTLPTPVTLEILRYLHKQGADWNVETFHFAAWHGNLPCLIYLHTHGCPCDAYGIALAAGGGYLSCLVYLHAEGCPWDERTVSYALSQCNWRCALYAITHGCAWHKLSRVLSRYFVGVLACIVVCTMPDPWYYAAKISVAVIDHSQEVYDTYRFVCEFGEGLLGEEGLGTLMDAAHNYFKLLKTPITWYIVYPILLYIYDFWLNW